MTRPRQRLATIGDLLAQGFELHALYECGHQEQLDLLALSVAHGENTEVYRVWPTFVCRQCGARNVGLGTNPWPGP